MNCCFTGHRSHNLPWGSNENDKRCIELKIIIRNLIEKSYREGYREFFSGMALGMDMISAEAVLSAKENHSDISLCGVIPCLNQEEKWNSTCKERYRHILENCDSKLIVSPVYTKSCMQVRNRIMVDNSQRVIALFNGSFRGGTASTVRYAQSQGREIILIRPDDLSIKIL